MTKAQYLGLTQKPPDSVKHWAAFVGIFLTLIAMVVSGSSSMQETRSRTISNSDKISDVSDNIDKRFDRQDSRQEKRFDRIDYRLEEIAKELKRRRQ